MNTAGEFHSRYRQYGGEQSFWKAGIFKIRLPFIHYAWSVPEMLQGLLMCATCLGAIPVLTDVLGVSYEVALSMVIINGFLYTLHVLLGDPVVPGWVTPSIPITIAFLNGFAMGVARNQALVATQLILGVIFLFFGLTGLGSKMVNLVPQPVKAGILMGGGISAVIGEMVKGGRFSKYPISIFIGLAIAYLCLFSPLWQEWRKKNRLINEIGKYGMLPAIIVAVIIGPIVKELAIPDVVWWPLIKIPEFGNIWNQLSPFAIGWPSASTWMAAIPMAIVIYIIAFGDFVTAQALINDADIARVDEVIDFNADRSNLVSGIRNVTMALTCPYTQMCGPLWAAVTAAVATRYKEGPQAMESIYSGAGSFRITTFIAVALMPISSLLQPVLPVALSLTLLVQGYVCCDLAMGLCRDNVERGICGVMGAVLATRGAAWGLAAGIFLFFLLFKGREKKPLEVKADALNQEGGEGSLAK